MIYKTIIDATTLASKSDDPNWRVIDCRFSLADTSAGEKAYTARHVSGAVYAHLDRDLSGPIHPGVTGRHPLPAAEDFAATLSKWGIDESVQVVAYDDMGGAIAARLWWMLTWMGHEAAAVLDGGWDAAIAFGVPMDDKPVRHEARRFKAAPNKRLIADAAEVDRLRNDADWRVLDARGADRYRGENENIDPVAGHIPGAYSLPFMGNLNQEKRFLDAAALRRRFTEALDGVTPEQAVIYCGSGVTAAHNLLAMAHVGMEGARLYPGSWSEWITDKSRPVATTEN